RAPLGRFDEALCAELAETFHRTHEQLWAFRADDLPITILNIRVALASPTPKPKLRPLAKGTGKPADDAVMYRRVVHWASDDGPREVPFYDRTKLLAGDVVEGPAAIVEKTTTTLLHLGDTCSPDEHSNLRITKGILNG